MTRCSNTKKLKLHFFIRIAITDITIIGNTSMICKCKVAKNISKNSL